MDLISSDRAGVTAVGPNTTAFLAPLPPAELGGRRAPAPRRRAAAVRRSGAGAAGRPAARGRAVGRRRRGLAEAVAGARVRRRARPASWSPSLRSARTGRPSPIRSCAPPPAGSTAPRLPTSRASWRVSERHLRRLGERRGGLRAQAARPGAAAAPRAGARAGRGRPGRGRLTPAATPTRPTSPTTAAPWPASRLAVFCKTRPARPAQHPAMTETAKLGWVIVYVPDVEAAIAFYERASASSAASSPRTDFGELDTGETKLGVRGGAAGRGQLRRGRPRARAPTRPFNVELALVFDDVERRLRARRSRTVPRRSTEPKHKPWGQVVAYVRDPFGTLGGAGHARRAQP